jgi:hypothetical protein
VDLKGNTLQLAPDASFTGTPAIVTSTDVPNANYTHSFTMSSQNAQGVFDLIMNNADDLNLDGDFTIEFWMKRTPSSPAFSRILNSKSTTEHYLRFQSYSTTLSTLRVHNGSNYTFGGLGPDETWEHVALVRDAGNLKQYDDGTTDSNTNVPAAWVLAKAGDATMNIGYRYNGGANADNTGPNIQIAMLRIYKDYVKYTSNFTPE